jgi:hypothetical protein
MTSSPAAATDSTLLARDLSEETIKDKCEMFVDFQLWPTHSVIDKSGWLSNFDDTEMKHALHLLNSFYHISDHLADKILLTTIRNLSRELFESGDTYRDLKARWIDFLSGLIITFPVDDERPSPTDSGYHYARRVRQVVGIPQDQILSPESTVRAVEASATPRNVVFVDDFAGTGLQYLAIWKRRFETAPGTFTSFSDLSARGKLTAYYAPLLSTSFAKWNIRRGAPSTVLRPGHLLTDRYNALNPDGLIWPPSLAATAPRFLERASNRAQIPDTDGTTTKDWRGFAKLGLTFSIGDSIPDASLPLIYWEENGWKPLKRRT